MNAIKNKKALELKNKIQTQIAKYNSQLNSKKSFRQTQVLSLKKKYNAKSNDLVPQFENIVTADVYISAVTEILNNLKILYQNPDLLVESKKLPSDIQVALEYCNAVAKVDKQPDLHNLIKGLIDKHKALTDISITHETYVYFGAEQITHEDAEKFYPAIKHECNLVEDQYLSGALSKYNDLFQVQLQQPFIPQQIYQNFPLGNQFTQPLPQGQFIPQNMPQQQNQFTTQTLPQVPQFQPQNLSQPPQFTNQTQQIPQFINQTQQIPQFTPQNLSQPPQFTPPNSAQQPQFTPPNSAQQPQFTPPNSAQQPQFATQTLQQPPQFTPQNTQQLQNNLYQSPYQSDSPSPQNSNPTLPQPPQAPHQDAPQFTPQNAQNPTEENSYHPPQNSVPPPFAPPPFAPPPTAPPQLSEVAGNMTYPQVPVFGGQNGQGGK